MRAVLVPIDGSECSLQAVRYLILARANGQRPLVHLLNVQLAMNGDVSQFVARSDIDDYRREESEQALRAAWRVLANECAGDASRFRGRWLAEARNVAFDEVNDLIDRHNRWYPVESRLPMDPRRGDYALVNGRDYRLATLDADWVLERFPPVLERVRLHY